MFFFSKKEIRKVISSFTYLIKNSRTYVRFSCLNLGANEVTETKFQLVFLAKLLSHGLIDIKEGFPVLVKLLEDPTDPDLHCLSYCIILVFCRECGFEYADHTPSTLQKD